MVDSVVPSTEPKEPTTVTSDQIVYQQRVRALDHARKTGNVAQTLQTFGISRKRVHQRLPRIDLCDVRHNFNRALSVKRVRRTTNLRVTALVPEPVV